MSTRARIGILLKDLSVESVYHHWDGYPEWLGVTLKSKFNTFEKVAELIDGGDMSSCDSNDDWDRKELGETAPLYYNDRGEKTEPRLDLNFDDYVNNANACEEYVYVFTSNHTWECYQISHKYDDDYNIVDTNVIPATIPEPQLEEAVA